MSQEEIQRIGAYTQFGRDRNEQQGAGMGLTLALKIAQLYNGSLKIQSSPSTGAEVSLRLPLE